MEDWIQERNLYAYWIDPNAVRRKAKVSKYFLSSQNKAKQDIERIKEKINTINWTNETLTEKKRLYLELGEIIKIYKNNTERIKWYRKDLLEKANLTG